MYVIIEPLLSRASGKSLAIGLLARRMFKHTAISKHAMIYLPGGMGSSLLFKPIKKEIGIAYTSSNENKC
jgi:hypothetical protein